MYRGINATFGLFKFVMRLVVFIVCFLLIIGGVYSQSIEEKITSVEQEKAKLQKQMALLDQQLIDLTHKSLIADLHQVGLPSENYIEHSAMILEYDEAHEQAKWVAHIISPKIKSGLAYRTNDFREDPKVKTGTAVQEDYFLTDTLQNGKVKYDGFGFDRGHLAPSADFRWSKVALSESYFYSNMSPQLADFNRKKWAELENHLRQYVLANEVPLMVVTMPLLNKELPTVQRAVNKLSIPEQYAKAVYDPVNKRGIAFLMENKRLDYPLESYAVSIDEVEEVSGLNVFKNLSESIESKIEKEAWFDDLQNGDREPIYALDLPKGSFNTIQATYKVGQKATVCGHVVASRYSKKGHLWLNMDKHFPNQVFSVFIKKEDLANFDFDIKERYTNQSICVSGKVEKFSDTPSITLSKPNNVEIYSIDSEEE